MRRDRLGWFVVPAVLCLFSSVPQASTVMQLNLGELVQRADRIYRGTVLSVAPARSPSAAASCRSSIYRLRVEEVFRGEFTR